MTSSPPPAPAAAALPVSLEWGETGGDPVRRWAMREQVRSTVAALKEAEARSRMAT